MNFMIVLGMLECSSFLISVYLFIVSRAFLIWSVIWLNPFVTVLFNVCSSVTVERCVLFQCCVGEFGLFAVM